MSVKSRVLEARKRERLTQSEIAAAVGISRQAYLAIELDKAIPSTEVALKLGRRLHAKVEDLFCLDDNNQYSVRAEMIGETPVSNGTRVQLFEVGQRLLARPLVEDSAEVSVLNLADATVAGGINSINLVDVNLMGGADQKMPTLALGGSDPAISFIAPMMRERGVRIVWLEASSMAAIKALARGEIHVAGCHYRDKTTGVYNAPLVKSIVSFPCTIVRFANEQQGFILRKGNPKSIQKIDDIARPDITIINRQEGSGARGLMHRLMHEARLQPSDISGHDHCVTGDLAVARIVRAGLADCGVGVVAAAHAAGLGFLALDEEPYDFVIPNHFMDLPAVQLLLTLLRSRELGRQVEALGGYDASMMGKSY